MRPRGEDLRRGELVMAAGKTLTPADLGMLASVNRAMVEVVRRPRVAIVATGDELVDVDQPPTGAQVVNSSAYALAGAIREAGAEAAILKVARDDAREIRERLAEAMAFDAVLSTGGVSVGQFDHVKGALDELGMRQLFHGVAQKPGRPLKFGTISYRPVFGLPGNPVSTLVCFYLYARPAILKMSGRRRVGLPRVNARCAVDIKLSKDLTEFVRVKLEQQRPPRTRKAAGDADRRPRLGDFKLAIARRRTADRPVNRNDAEGGRSGDRAAAGHGARWARLPPMNCSRAAATAIEPRGSRRLRKSRRRLSPQRV